MEKLTINIPEAKSALVKQILSELGVTFQQDIHKSSSSYRKKIVKVSTWSIDDIKVFEESTKAFESLKPQQW
ncbi:hypothetical protein [Mucilaginibacter sp. FT3.2]|uniref:hypothetical protein n=1 Tax=Mucilaginibacter sp. FT3.2 TaxID=2723090 RepID=UPI00161F8AC1|nr:hypothetical protein [Mucilaginibacter sp. FT3.2]MBB6232567.1 hypothetical protein [Mucilaginibacter sp. FT3.2]